MRELLIRYLLGELEPHEHDAVQKQLVESPELRRELAHLRSCFAESREADDDFDGPPRDLAKRTAVWVSESDSYDALPSRKETLSEANDAPAGVLGWSLADLTVAGGVILAVSMFLFPALRDSRDGSRLVVCQNNQRQFGQLILAYMEENHGYVPEVQPGENAAIFTVRLLQTQDISREKLIGLLFCPNAPTANAIRAGQQRIIIPSQAELDRMSDAQLARVRPWMSPHYAYCFGYRKGNQYHYIHRSQGGQTPILCDAPGDADDSASLNHGGPIALVLKLDGSVAIRTPSNLQGIDADMYHNAAGEVAPGLGRRDSVLAPSQATPNIFLIDPDPSEKELLQWRKMGSDKWTARPASAD